MTCALPDPAQFLIAFCGFNFCAILFNRYIGRYEQMKSDINKRRWIDGQIDINRC